MFKNILVPTDGSELSDSTVERAISFAKDAGARITFFYAQPDFPTPLYGEGALFDPTTPEQFSKAAAAEAEKILTRYNASATAGSSPTVTPSSAKSPSRPSSPPPSATAATSSSWHPMAGAA
jgi:nucleotide-binding universal stress UspA family protein